MEENRLKAKVSASTTHLPIFSNNAFQGTTLSKKKKEQGGSAYQSP